MTNNLSPTTTGTPRTALPGCCFQLTLRFGDVHGGSGILRSPKYKVLPSTTALPHTQPLTFHFPFLSAIRGIEGVERIAQRANE